jgi:hypothetical protein
MTERLLEDKIKEIDQVYWGRNFVAINERPVSPGLSEFHLNRPVAEGEYVQILPGRVHVGRVDTTKGTLK